MSEWKEYRLGDLCNIRRGSSPRPIQNFLSETGMPWIKIADATATDSPYIKSTKQCIIPEGVKSSVVVRPGDFIVSNSATPGLPRFVEIDACIHDGWLLLSDFNGIDKSFLFYKFFQIKESLINQANGSVFQNLKTDIVKDFNIKLPPLSEQKGIAAILSSLDEKIETNRKINARLEELAQALFKSWFIDFEPFGGKMPKDWKRINIGALNIEISDFVANGSFSSLKENVTLYDKPEFAYFIRNTDLKVNFFSVFVDEHSYKFLSKSRLFGGEIIISNVGDVGSVFLCPTLDKPMTLGNNIIMVRPQKDCLTSFLYLFFRSYLGQHLIDGITGGSAQPKFNKTDFKRCVVILPKDDTLMKFENIMRPILTGIEHRSKESAHLAALRDALLPKLMSGEIKLS